MKYIWNEGLTDPRVNLALEEYALRHFRDDEAYLLFYVNAPSVIIGRNQNTVEEIDTRLTAARDLPVVRRMSGGGAVYHDFGNLNFSFITPYTRERFNRYEEVTRPIVDVLQDIGVRAELSGRNDITVDGRKVSGNAQFSAAGRMFSHGTLLFDADLDAVAETLRPRPGKVESKGAKSVRSRVANISDFIPGKVTMDELRGQILRRLFGDRVAEATRTLNHHEWRGVRNLVAEKYGAWDWNIGQSPASNLQRVHRFSSGEVDARLKIEGGHVHEVRILGDFFGRQPVARIEDRLRGVQHDSGAILEALAPLDVPQHVSGVTAAELADLLAG